MRGSGLLLAFFLAAAAPDAAAAAVREYATEQEVLERAFPGAEIEKKRLKISPGERERIEELIKGKYFKKSISFHIARKEGRTLGYATVPNEVGKTRRITFMVVMDRDGKVKSVDILVFRESHGYEIENPRWRKQFEGKTIEDPIRPRRDIKNISGATLSVRAVTRGVKKALAAFEVLRPRLEE
ncbi:MAG: FMN-binding protein [Thermodesulfobacteriota bacterium]